MDTEVLDIINLLDTASSDEVFKEVANSLKKTSVSAEFSWLKPYYLGVCYVLHSMLPLSDSRRDALVMLAEAQAARVKLLVPKEAEYYVLKAFCLQAKIMVSTFLRGPLYISEVEKVLEQALSLDADNPRAYFLLGQATLNKPFFMGGGKHKAQPLLEKAIEKFRSAQPETSLHPSWGQRQVQALLEEIA